MRWPRQGPPASAPRRRLGPIRTVAFAILTTAAVFALANLVIEKLEREELVDTLGEAVVIQDVLDDLYEKQGDRFVSTSYSLRSVMQPQSFAAEKGDRWRLFVSGGSFAMGSPYTPYEDDLWAGIPAYLDASLKRVATREVEIVNAAAGGQDSGRVAAIARAVLRYEPDALLIATCNNEGVLPPSEVEAALQRTGGYRLLKRMLRRPAQRSWHVQQDPATDRIRARFRANLEAIVTSAEAAGVRVYLATIPANLDYESFQLGKMVPTDEIPDPRFERLIETLGTPLLPLPDGWHVNACVPAYVLSDAGFHEEALPWLQRCLRPPAPVQEPQMARGAGIRLAWSWLRRGEKEAEAREVLAELYRPCTIDGMVAYAHGRPEDALAILRSCEGDAGEVLRWSGLAERRLGHERAARTLLRQSVELQPRNRCRPSFNAEIRAVAAGHDGAVLVDLDEAFDGLPPAPPPERWFMDYCHMSWRGYAEMGAVAFDAIRLHEAGLAPQDAAPLPAEEFGRLRRVPPGGPVEQWRHFLHRGNFPKQ